VAVQTKSENAAVLDALAVAYCSAGRTADAIRTLEKAIDVASSAGPEGLADHFRQRLESYKSREQQ
jgi:hypothetical protein